jgi:thioredoxin reductase (NADPH)
VHGITGPEMMEQFKQQAERFDTKIHYDYIVNAEFSNQAGGIHRLITGNGATLNTRSVIIATGASAKYLGLESENRLKGGGVSACATCDGFFFKGKTVAVVGGGDTALEEASYLSKLCQKVYLLVRKDVFKASKAMQHRVMQIKNIEILFSTEITEVLGDKVVTGIKVINNQNQNTSEIVLDGVFIAIGHTPNTQAFKGKLDLDNEGYIITEKGTTKTSVPGVFAAGDVQDKQYRQAITAAGSGCMAALDAERYIAEYFNK